MLILLQNVVQRKFYQRIIKLCFKSSGPCNYVWMLSGESVLFLFILVLSTTRSFFHLWELDHSFQMIVVQLAIHLQFIYLYLYIFLSSIFLSLYHLTACHCAFGILWQVSSISFLHCKAWRWSLFTQCCEGNVYLSSGASWFSFKDQLVKRCHQPGRNCWDC